MSETFFTRIKGKVFTGEKSERIVLPEKDAITAPHIIDSRVTPSGYLTGQLLVATPMTTGTCFHKSVIYVFSHNDEGAMGIIINQPIEMVHFSTLIESLKLPENATRTHIPVYFGGPVDKSRGFVVHSSDYFADFSLMKANGIAVTASSGILQDIVSGKGPKNAILGVGYAGWTAGQLESEIAENSWITVPATPGLIFGTEDELKWATAGKSLGIDMDLYSNTIGHA